MVEGRRPVEGKASSNACPGLCAGYGVSLKLRACGLKVNGPPKPRTSIAFDLRQEPGAGKPHAGICAGCALKAHETMSPGMATAAKPSRQPRTESCVVSGNGPCEA